MRASVSISESAAQRSHMALVDKLTSQSSLNFIGSVEKIYQVVPFKLPEGVVNFFVNIAPYLAFLGAVIGLIIGPLGALNTLASFLTLDIKIIFDTFLTLILLGLSTYLSIKAYKPLKNREMKGWILLFWMYVLNILTAVSNILLNSQEGTIGSIIGSLIGIYIITQMKHKYTEVMSTQVRAVVG